MRDHSPGFIVPSPIPLSTLEADRSKSVAEEEGEEGREGSEVVVGSAGGRSVDGLEEKITESKKERRKKGNQLSGQSTVINDNRM